MLVSPLVARAFAVALASVVWSLCLPASFAKAASGQGSVSACQSIGLKMYGAAGQPCEAKFVLKRVDGLGDVTFRHESVTIRKPPSFGTLVARTDEARNSHVLIYRPNGREPVVDSFEYERCFWSKKQGSFCRTRTVTVELSAKGESKAATRCLPQPFQLSTSKPVLVTMAGSKGSRCSIRLFLSRYSLKSQLVAPPQGGSVTIERHRIFYRHFGQSDSDQFRIRSCVTKDADTCIDMHVSLSFR